MSTIADVLADHALTWEPDDQDRLVMHHDDDELARIDGNVVILGDRRMELHRERAHMLLVDTGRGARVATIRLVDQGSGRIGAVTLADRRIRVCKVAVNPWRWKVTEGLGGAELLTATKLFGRLRIKAGADFQPEVEADVAVVALALTALDVPQTAGLVAA